MDQVRTPISDIDLLCKHSGTEAPCKSTIKHPRRWVTIILHPFSVKPFFRVTTRTTLHYRDRTKPCPFPSYGIKNHNTTVRFSFGIIFTHVYYYHFRQININKHQSFKRRKQTVCIKISFSVQYQLG